MKTPHESAYPLAAERYEPQFGLTKRELFAAMCLQGILANSRRTNSVEYEADIAVRYADALIAELDKPEQV